MSSGDFVQADRAEGARLVELPTEGFGFGFGVQHGRPAVVAVHGQVPDGWLAADRVAA